MKKLILLALLQAAPVQAPQRPQYHAPIVTDLQQGYAECSIDLRQVNRFASEQESYIKTLEAQIAELKKNQK